MSDNNSEVSDADGSFSGNPPVSSPGMLAVQGAINFSNNAVLKADFSPMTGTGKLLAEQAAGMMMQDVTSFSQGLMQIATAAIAKATAEIIATDGEKGKKSLTEINTALAELPKFVTKMADAAKHIDDDFSNSGGKNGTSGGKTIVG